MELSLKEKIAALKAERAAKELATQLVVDVTTPLPIPTEPKVFTGITAKIVEPELKPEQIQPVATIGTERTSDIDHLDFLSKLDELQQAIHHTHPHMPVLLMKIHKQLTADPELVTVLSEDQIGIIVNGLKIQTKTELVGTIAKQAKSRDKKTKLTADMF